MILMWQHQLAIARLNLYLYILQSLTIATLILLKFIWISIECI